MIIVFALILLGFILGVVVVVAAEALGLLWVVKRLDRRISRDQAKIASKTQLDGSQSDSNQQLLKKEGVVWVLEPDKVSKFWVEKQSKEQKKKKDVMEVTPVRKYGKINGQSLVITDADGFHTAIQLKGCSVEAVSATSLPSKKWAKKYPIKVEAKTSVIYHRSKTLYIYLETACEKEAWCKALRLASSDKKEKHEWFAQLQDDFRSYLTSLDTEYHSHMKPSGGSIADAIERASKPDGGSKVRQFLKKLTKKSSKVGVENKSAWTSLSGREERKSTDRLRSCQDAVLATAFMKSTPAANQLKLPLLENAAPSSSTISRSTSQSQFSDADTNEKLGIDEGTLCWNLLVSRLFFDVKENVRIKKSIQERIQRTLGNMRTPSYVGEVVCTEINMGNVPPCIIRMRVLPMEMSEVCALEVDIEYSGGALLEIETRLEVGELELERERAEDSNPESSNDGAVPSDFLEGFEYLGEQLNLAEGMNDLQEPKGDDVPKSSKQSTSSSSQGSRWKSMLNSVAKHVSQVPLTLGVRIASLKGTLRLQIKPPPSDQLWFGFTFMPDIDFSLESFVGERKITNSHIAMFMVNRLKAAIRDTLVLPNCESICISWMLAEKDDWVPKSVAPFIWIRHESGNETSTSVDTNNQPSGGLKANSKALIDSPDFKPHKPPKCTKSSQEPARKSDSVAFPPISSCALALRSSKSSEELTRPFLENAKSQETRDLQEPGTTLSHNDNTHEGNELVKIGDISVSESPPRNKVLDKQDSSIEQDDSRPRKIGRKERMLDLKKRMSEKFEEKKRNFEEKGRNIVEKMRGP
ncbi:hypothetical protein ACSQ67_009148 [Phaseolus vulgaris]